LVLEFFQLANPFTKVFFIALFLIFINKVINEFVEEVVLLLLLLLFDDVLGIVLHLILLSLLNIVVVQKVVLLNAFL
jgi:hypothetical protein